MSQQERHDDSFFADGFCLNICGHLDETDSPASDFDGGPCLSVSAPALASKVGSGDDLYHGLFSWGSVISDFLIVTKLDDLHVFAVRAVLLSFFVFVFL